MLPSSIIAQESRGLDNEVLQMRIHNLLKVEESRSKAIECFKQQQEVVKRWFDKHKAGTKEFEVGDLVLKWDHPHDEKGKHTNFQQLWIVPFSDCRKDKPLNLQIARFTGVGGELTSEWFSSQAIFFLSSCVSFVHK